MINSLLITKFQAYYGMFKGILAIDSSERTTTLMEKLDVVSDIFHFIFHGCQEKTE